MRELTDLEKLEQRVQQQCWELNNPPRNDENEFLAPIVAVVCIVVCAAAYAATFFYLFGIIWP